MTEKETVTVAGVPVTVTVDDGVLHCHGDGRSGPRGRQLLQCR